MLTVADIMTRTVVSIKGTTTVRELAGIFEKSGFGSLPIVDDAGNLTGIVTASDLNSGIYFYRITAGGFSQSQKMILIKYWRGG